MKKTKEDYKENFIEKARKKWGETTYDYCEVEYVNAKTKVKITCNEHGLTFYQTPDSHLNYCGCPKCVDDKIRNLAISKRENRDIITEFKKVHGDKYDYSKVDFVGSINNKNKVIVICPDHGEFEIDYNSHLNGCGCNKCTGRRYETQEEFISLAKSLYGDKYCYDKVKYINSTTPITITCNEHNQDFQVLPLNFLRPGHFSCPECDTRVVDTQSFIIKSKEIYGDDLFDFSETIYNSSKERVKIICKYCGRILEVIPDKFLREQYECDCQKSGKSSLEESVLNLLLELFNPEDILKQYWFNDLIYIRKLKFDFYIKSKNLLIECQGRQHFLPIDYFGGEAAFKEQKKRDILKFDYCENNKINLLYFCNQKDFIDFGENYISKELYFDINKLKSKILSL